MADSDFKTDYVLQGLGDVFAKLPQKDRDVLLAIFDTWLHVLADQFAVLIQTDRAKSIFKVPVEFQRENIAFTCDDTTRVIDAEVLERGGGVSIAEFRPGSLTVARDCYFLGIRVDPLDASRTRVRIFETRSNALNDVSPIGESFSPGFGTKVVEPIGGFGGAPTPLVLKTAVRVATTQIVANEGTAPVYSNVGGVSGRGQITWTVGPTLIDVIAIANGDRLLLKNEGDFGGLGADANGIWVRTAAATWDRATDFDADPEVVSDTFVGVLQGTANGLRSFQLTTADPITIGGAAGTALTFVEFVGARLSYTYTGAPAVGAVIRKCPDRFAYTIDSEIESIPELFSKTGIGADVPQINPLLEGVDFIVGKAELVFLTEPAPFQFAKMLFQNRKLVFDNFGFLIDFLQDNSRTYRRSIQGLWFAFWNGPTPDNIELGAAILLGFAVSEPGRVLDIRLNIDGSKTVFVKNRNGITTEFTISAAFVPFIVVAVGFDSDKFFPIVKPFEVQDYLINRNIAEDLAFPPVQKFFQWFIVMDEALWIPFINELDPGEVISLAAIGNFLERIEPRYTRGILVTRKDLLDTFSLTSSLDVDQQIVQGEARINQNWVNYLFFVAYQVVNGETEATYLGGSQPDWDLDTDTVSLIEHITINDLPIDGGALLYEEAPP
jgi:hypothetical protein